jgi:hypothetical protein
MEKILENYIFPNIKKEEIETVKQNILVSIIIFLLSLFSRAEAYAVVYSIDVGSVLKLFFTNLVGVIFVLFVFTIWIGFVSVLFKKNIFINKYFSGLLNMFSIYMLLLPISLLLLFLNLKFLYFFIEMFFGLIVLSRILKYTKEFCGFSEKEMLFIVGVPIVFISLIFLLPVIYILLFIYGKI